MKWIFQSPFYPEESETLIASNFSKVAEQELDHLSGSKSHAITVPLVG